MFNARKKMKCEESEKQNSQNAEGQNKAKHRPCLRSSGKVTRKVEEVYAGSVDTVFVDLEKNWLGHGMLSNAIGELTKCEATQLENNAR